MNSKLTLKLNQEVIEKAKFYAAEKHLSLSQIIENYLSSLTIGVEDESKISISPFIKSLSTEAKIPADLNYKEEYASFLAEKHQ